MHQVPQLCPFHISTSHSPGKGFSEVYTKCFLLGWSIQTARFSLDGKIQVCYQIHIVTALRSPSPSLALKRKEDVGDFPQEDIPGRVLQPGRMLCLLTNSYFKWLWSSGTVYTELTFRRRCYSTHGSRDRPLLGASGYPLPLAGGTFSLHWLCWHPP